MGGAGGAAPLGKFKIQISAPIYCKVGPITVGTESQQEICVLVKVGCWRLFFLFGSHSRLLHVTNTDMLNHNCSLCFLPSESYNTC